MPVLPGCVSRCRLLCGLSWRHIPPPPPSLVGALGRGNSLVLGRKSHVSWGRCCSSGNLSLGRQGVPDAGGPLLALRLSPAPVPARPRPRPRPRSPSFLCMPVRACPGRLCRPGSSAACVCVLLPLGRRRAVFTGRRRVCFSSQRHADESCSAAVELPWEEGDGQVCFRRRVSWRVGQYRRFYECRDGADRGVRRRRPCEEPVWRRIHPRQQHYLCFGQQELGHGRLLASVYDWLTTSAFWNSANKQARSISIAAIATALLGSVSLWSTF